MVPKIAPRTDAARARRRRRLTVLEARGAAGGPGHEQVDRQRGIVADVLPPRPQLAPPAYWVDDAGPDRPRFRLEVQRHLTRGLNFAMMREWVEPDARPAFDALIVELVRRGELLAEAYVAAGMPPLKKVLKRYDDAKLAGSRGGRVRGAQQVAAAQPERARLRKEAAQLERKTRSEQTRAELMGVSRKRLRKALGKRA